MSGPIRGIITVLLMLLVTFPAVSLTPLAAERAFYPELRTPPGTDAAEALFTFEQILLNRGFRVTRHVYLDAQAALIMESWKMKSLETSNIPEARDTSSSLRCRRS